ncbi:MAG: G1 family glutamic endopeptidase [Candidatus Sulfotelmatobacter sp.]
MRDRNGLTRALLMGLTLLVVAPSPGQTSGINQKSTAPGGRPPATWTSTFEKIKNPDIMQVLHAQEKDWGATFRAMGKSAEQLTAEAEIAAQRLRSEIASDDAALNRTMPHPAAGLAPAQCKAALHNPRDPLFPLCDKALREDELLAVSGMIELLPQYASLLPAPPKMARYGLHPGSEVIGKVTIHVVAQPTPNPAIVNLAAPDSQARVITLSDNKRVVDVQQGQKVIVRFLEKGKRSPGVVVQPATGVLEAEPGTVHYPADRLIVLTAVKPGTATIDFTGPLASENGSGCTECWSGYVVTGGPFYGAQGSWIVPQVDTQVSPCSSIASSEGFELCSSSSTWVGLDGYGESQLIQTGTDQSYMNGILGLVGGASYSAWWEILPANEQTIYQPVYPGDAIVASIVPTPGSTAAPNVNSSWRIELTDLTQQWTFVTTRTFTGPLDTAEWIEEDPTDNYGFGSSKFQLANYEQVLFDFRNRVATTPPSGPNFAPTWVSPNLSPNEKLSIDQDNYVFSTPSDPDADLDGFYVTYSNWGANQSAPPAPWIEGTILPPALLNQAYSYSLSAYEEQNSFEPNGPAWAWAMVGGTLPSGLSMDPSSGIISGTPTTVGTQNFSVVATDMVTGAFSQTENYSAVVTSQPSAILTIACGPLTPPFPGAGFAISFRNTAVPCNSTFVLDAGSYSVSATTTGLPLNYAYKIFLGGACNSTGQITLTQGQVAQCTVWAESLSLIETAGCTPEQKCCEPSATGCKRCIRSTLRCP